MSSSEIQWGVKWEIPSGSHVDVEPSEASARRSAAWKPAQDQTITLLRREVIYGDWKPVQ
jgi:hypothetical protein